MEELYWKQLIRRQHANKYTDSIIFIVPFSFCWLSEEEPNQASCSSSTSRLQRLLLLFAGRESALDKDKSGDVSALCSNLICAFFGILANLGSDQPHIDASSKIHVLPGRISHEQRLYAMLTDGRPEMVHGLLNRPIDYVQEYANSMTVDVKLFA